MTESTRVAAGRVRLRTTRHGGWSASDSRVPVQKLNMVSVISSSPLTAVTSVVQVPGRSRAVGSRRHPRGIVSRRRWRGGRRLEPPLRLAAQRVMISGPSSPRKHWASSSAAAAKDARGVRARLLAVASATFACDKCVWDYRAHTPVGVQSSESVNAMLGDLVQRQLDDSERWARERGRLCPIMRYDRDIFGDPESEVLNGPESTESLDVR